MIHRHWLHTHAHTQRASGFYSFISLSFRGGGAWPVRCLLMFLLGPGPMVSYCWTCPCDPPVPRVPAARVAPHSRVFCVRRGGKGGHGGVCRREVQPVSDGVYHLQRDCPPQLSEGDPILARLFCPRPSPLSSHVSSAPAHLLCPRPSPRPPQMGKAEGIINDEIPNCWECPKCHQEGKTSKVSGSWDLQGPLRSNNVWKLYSVEVLVSELPW